MQFTDFQFHRKCLLGIVIDLNSNDYLFLRGKYFQEDILEVFKR